MSTKELIVLLSGEEIGRTTQNAQGRLQFTYNEAWRNKKDAYPLSLSMPLLDAEHGHNRIEPFLWGLLPDNSSILSQWGKRFQVSARNAFALLSHVGEDCAGAVQFVRPERLEAVLTVKRGDVQWLDEEGVAERLRLLRADQSAWRIGKDNGQFSLAGAQPKTALLFEKGRWGVPSGRIPTTHILKPPNPNGQLDGFPENEHFCLEVARALGLPTANSRVLRFEDEPAIVVERYDRVRTAGGWGRIHQEDICQALGVAPSRKYQDDGGPGARTVVDLLNSSSSARNEDRDAFVHALVLNWLIAGTDAHAKNYSLLIAGEGRVRLAPLYDVASVLPYPQFDLHKVKLAMKIGGKYKIWDVGIREWSKLAAELRMDEAALIEGIAGMAREMPDRVAEIAREMTNAGLKHPVIGRLSTRMIARARLCLKQFGT